MKSGSLSIEGSKVYYIHNGVPKVPQVVLLHGKGFTAKLWEDIGTMKVLGDAGYSALSINLPNHYPSYDTDLIPRAWLFAIMNKMHIKAPVIIAACIGGDFAVPYMLNYPKRISGFIGIAPINLERYHEAYPKVTIPVLGIWGEKDDVVPHKYGKFFAESVKNGAYEVMAGGDHAPHVKDSKVFNNRVIEFVKGIKIP